MVPPVASTTTFGRPSPFPSPFLFAAIWAPALPASSVRASVRLADLESMCRPTMGSSRCLDDSSMVRVVIVLGVPLTSGTGEGGGVEDLVELLVSEDVLLAHQLDDALAALQ